MSAYNNHPSNSNIDAMNQNEQNRLPIKRMASMMYSIVLLGYAFIMWQLLPDLSLSPSIKSFIFGLMLTSAIIIPFALLSKFVIKNQKVSDIVNWVATICMGWFSTAFVLTLLRELILLLPLFKAWRSQSALMVLVFSALISLLGMFNARRTAKVKKVTIQLANLPKALQGFKIVQLSDIHVGATIKVGYIERLVKKVNALQADVVVITGDVVDGSVENLAPDVAPLAKLTALHGVYIVTGNHEYYSGADAWMDHFKQLGIKPLRNQHEVINHNNSPLILAGVDDYSASRMVEGAISSPELSLVGAPKKAPRILLAHQPRSSAAALKAGFDLQLSGHTHGGQFWPWNHFVRLQQPYTAGLHRLENMWIYTSRGTGYWGPPMRFLAPSEITEITLQ